MSARKLALEALKQACETLSSLKPDNFFEKAKQGQAWDALKGAIAALESELAQAVEPVGPGMKQLIAQLNDEQKWTVSEQQQFAEFLKRFPNESSQGIISLGDAWKHGRACAAPQEPAAPAWMPIETAPKDGTDVIVMYMHIDTQIVHNAFWITEEEEPGYSGWWSYDKSEVGRILLDDWMTPAHWMALPPAPGGAA